MAGARDTDIETILTQLSAARWYLDRAGFAAPEAARQDIANARQAYDTALHLLTQSHLEEERLEELKQEMTALRDRLLAAGEQV